MTLATDGLLLPFCENSETPDVSEDSLVDRTEDGVELLHPLLLALAMVCPRTLADCTLNQFPRWLRLCLCFFFFFFLVILRIFDALLKIINNFFLLLYFVFHHFKLVLGQSLSPSLFR